MENNVSKPAHAKWYEKIADKWLEKTGCECDNDRKGFKKSIR